jgi:hypothetical protein
MSDLVTHQKKKKKKKPKCNFSSKKEAFQVLEWDCDCEDPWTGVG